MNSQETKNQFRRIMEHEPDMYRTITGLTLQMGRSDGSAKPDDIIIGPSDL